MASLSGMTGSLGKVVKSMRLIDRNVPPQWWALAEYGARSGEWSEEPMGWTRGTS